MNSASSDSLSLTSYPISGEDNEIKCLEDNLMISEESHKQALTKITILEANECRSKQYVAAKQLYHENEGKRKKEEKEEKAKAAKAKEDEKRKEEEEKKKKEEEGS